MISLIVRAAIAHRQVFLSYCTVWMLSVSARVIATKDIMHLSIRVEIMKRKIVQT